MAENSKILIGLPNLPDENIEKKMWGEFLTVYRAIQNLLAGVSRYTGIDQPDQVEIDSMDPTAYLLGANTQQWYPTAAVPIARGQLVSVSTGLGANAVQLAQATGGGTHAIGIADETKAAGQRIRILTGGLTTAITGMVPGTLYYLATAAPGAVQNLRPIVPGQIIQPIGWALTSTQMLLSISSYYQQL